MQVTDARTNRTLYDSSAFKVSTGKIIDQMGVAAGSVNVSAPIAAFRAEQDRLEDAAAPWRRIWWFLRDERPWFAGVPWKQNQFTESNGSVQWSMARADKFLERREFNSTLVFRDVDQLDIIRNLIAYGIGLTPLQCDPDFLAIMAPLAGAQLPWLRLDSSVMSGVLRTREDTEDGYQRTGTKTVAQAVQALTDLQDVDGGTRAALGLPGALDYRLDYGRDADGTLWATPKLGYPRLGKADPLHVEFPGSLAGFTHAVDSGDTETASRVIGGGTGSARLVSELIYDTAALAAGWPLLMGHGTSTAIEQATLDDAARSRLADLAGDNEGWAIRLDPNQLGRYEFGDTLQPTIDHRRWGRPLYLPPQRIIGHELTPSSPGVAEQLVPLMQDAA